MRVSAQGDEETKRELRYIVIKIKDARAALTGLQLDHLESLCARVNEYRHDFGKRDLACVVVESDWPEYEPTWKAIETRVAAVPAQGATEGSSPNKGVSGPKAAAG